MTDPLHNPFWNALATEQSSHAIGGRLARRFPSDIIPFAGVASSGEDAAQALHTLLTPGESIYLVNDMPLPHPQLEQTMEMPALQMMHAPRLEQQDRHDPETVTIEQMQTADIPAMLRLKEQAFPGYFGPRAPLLGAFYGIRVEGALIAMAGERLALPGRREISAVCTHPGHTGKGYAAMLIRRLLRRHAQAGLHSFLQVVANNATAIALYRRLGFVELRSMTFRCVRRRV